MSFMRVAAAVSLFLVLSVNTGTMRADEVDAGEAAFNKRDYGTAVKLLMPMAQRGNAIAELYVGIMYFGGKGQSRDPREAVKWFKASARQGIRGAQTNLGIAYATGEGIPRNLLLAYMWFSLAAAHGNAAPKKYLDHVASEMNAEEVQRAHSLAEQCKASNYTNCEPRNQ